MAEPTIPLNIAEGNSKQSLKDKNRLFEIARGSARECAAIHDVLPIPSGTAFACFHRSHAEAWERCQRPTLRSHAEAWERCPLRSDAKAWERCQAEYEYEPTAET